MIETSYTPNAVHILADLVGVGALQLAELRISLDLEEYLIAILCCHLVGHTGAVSTKFRRKKRESRAISSVGAVAGSGLTLMLIGALSSALGSSCP